MSDHESKFQSCERGSLHVKEDQWSLRRRRHWFSSANWVSAALVTAAVIMLQAPPAHAQIVNVCPPELSGAAGVPGNTFFKVPEITSKDHKLRGTLILSDEQQWMAGRVPSTAPSDTSRSQCTPQFVRTFRELGATSTKASVPSGPFKNFPYALPRPGPTLRARVGDLVQLTFLNQIDPGDFSNSIDQGERGGCDETTAGYPGLPPGGDKFPDCFHGSSTGNIHFHGTHTNPGSTGDNVFIEVRPLPRDNQGKLTTTPEQVQVGLDKFFSDCEARLNGNPLLQWPKTWSDLPTDWTGQQQKLLNDYDTQMAKKYPPAQYPNRPPQKLWPVDAAQLAQREWPQYYIGAVPYCFRLPQYTEKGWPPPATASMQMGGAGTAEMHLRAGMTDSRSLMMGQAPGTHWYHAHKHGSTAINVSNGMTGAFIIEGQYDDDLNQWYGELWTQSQPVIVINQLGVSPNLMRTGASPAVGSGKVDKGPDFSVNGRLKPVIQMRPGEVQMWRIVNTSGRAGAYFLPPAKNTFQWKQLAQDGVQFNDSNYNSPENSNKSFLLAAGNRADLLVMAPPCTQSAGCMYPVMVKNEVDPSDLAGANPITLMSINVSGSPVDPNSNGAKFIPKAPTFPVFLQDITRDEVKGTKKILFASGAPGGLPTPATHTIDGKKFDGEVGEVVLLNTVEEWKVMNATGGISHPFHIHINPFQVVEVFDPNEALIDPKTGKAPINPKTRKPYVDPQTNKPAVKYAFHPKNLAPGQCYLNPNADPNDWKPCDPPTVTKNLIWWDVFPIPSAYAPTTDAAGKKPLLNSKGQPVQVPGFFKMRSRFVDYTGYYVIHCHILAHEDRGMMTVVEVAPARSPYSHH